MCRYEDKPEKSEDFISDESNEINFDGKENDHDSLYEMMTTILPKLSESEREVLYISYCQKKRLCGENDYVEICGIRREAFKKILSALIEKYTDNIDKFQEQTGKNIRDHLEYVNCIDAYLADELNETAQEFFEGHIFDCRYCGFMTLLGQEIINCLAQNKDLFSKVVENNIIEAKSDKTRYTLHKKSDSQDKNFSDPKVLSKCNPKHEITIPEVEHLPEHSREICSDFKKKPDMLCLIIAILIGLSSSGCSKSSNLLIRGRILNFWIGFCVRLHRNFCCLIECLIEYLLRFL